FHVRANRASEDIGGTREIFARNLVQLERKLKMLQAREAIRQLIDRVVRSRQRAMAAAIGDLELEILVRLLSSFDPDQFSLAVLQLKNTGIRIQSEVCGDQIGMVLDEPCDAVGLTAFFVGCEGE